LIKLSLASAQPQALAQGFNILAALDLLTDEQIALLSPEMQSALFHARERREAAEKFTQMSELIETPTALGAQNQNSEFETFVTIPVDHNIGVSFDVDLIAGALTFATEYQPSNPREIGVPALAAGHIHKLGPILAGRTLTPTCSTVGNMTIYALDEWSRASIIATGEVTETALAFTHEITDSKATSWDATAPADIESGDLLLIMVAADNNTTSDDIATPAGWADEGHFGGASPDATLDIFSKISDGTEGAVVAMTSAVSTYEQVTSYLRIPQASGIEVIGTPGIQSGNASFATAPDITTLSTNSMVMALTTTDGSLMIPDLHTAGWTEGWLEANPNNNAGGVGFQQHWQNFPTVGATGDFVLNYTVDVDQTMGLQIAIIPG
jgi:hypothetical protein